MQVRRPAPSRPAGANGSPAGRPAKPAEGFSARSEQPGTRRRQLLHGRAARPFGRSDRCARATRRTRSPRWPPPVCESGATGPPGTMGVPLVVRAGGCDCGHPGVGAAPGNHPPLAETERTRHVARKTIETRLAEIEAQKKTLKARLSKQERAHDTRRKVLLGALVLHRLQAGKDEESFPPPRRLAAPRIAGLPHPRRRQGALRRSAQAPRRSGAQSD